MVDLVNLDEEIFTYSGVLATPDNPPPIYDIAVSLGRVPRFIGNTMSDWPVLGHVINVANIAYRMGQYEVIPHCLLHDGSESLVGDIPTPFKAEHTKKLEKKILTALFARHNLLDSEDVWEDVHFFDKIALISEAKQLLIPKVAEKFDTLAEKYNISKAHIELATPALKKLIHLADRYIYAFRPGGVVVHNYVNAINKMTERQSPKEVFSEMLSTILP